MPIERVFAWEDKFRRLLLRFEMISELHDDQSPAFSARANAFFIHSPEGSKLAYWDQ